MPGFYYHEYLGGRIIGSENPLATGKMGLLAHKCREWSITDLLTLRITGLPQLDLPVHVHHVPVAGVPEHRHIETTNRIIGESLAQGGRIWIYCDRGIDRTGCVIGCYLARTGCHPDDVVDLLVEHAATRINHPRLRELLLPSYRPIFHFARPQPPPGSKASSP